MRGLPVSVPYFCCCDLLAFSKILKPRYVEGYAKKNRTDVWSNCRQSIQYVELNAFSRQYTDYENSKMVRQSSVL